MSSGEYLPPLLLSMNSEDLKGWIQCLSSRKFLVHTSIATKQGEIQVTVVLMCPKCYKHIILLIVLPHLTDLLFKLYLNWQKL